MLVSLFGLTGRIGVKGPYRALKLGALASSALDNVIEADFGADMLALGSAGDGAWSAITTAVADVIAVDLVEATMCA